MILSTSMKTTLKHFEQIFGAIIDVVYSDYYGVLLKCGTQYIVWDVKNSHGLDDHMILQLIEETKEYLGLNKPKLLKRLSKFFKNVKELK